MLGLNLEAAGAGIAAELSASLERIERNTGTTARKLLESYPQRALAIQGSLVGKGGGNAYTTIPGPEGGKEWHLRRVSFAPQLGTAAGTAGTLVLALSTGVLTSAQGSGQLVGGQVAIEVARSPLAPNGGTPAGGVPGYLVFSHSQIVIRPPNNLVVAWLSGTDGVPIVISGEVEEVLLGTDPDR